MSLMKFVSEPEKATYDAYSGFKKVFPAYTVDPERRIVISNKIEKDKVCILSGGGSGHEPFCAGFIGEGMLSGAVGGLVFASPPSNTILIAIRTLAEENNNAGVLVILNNYTGDVLNFGLATEEAKTIGIKVENVVIEDDCSITGDKVQGAGRRGMCGSCAAIKIAGEMARLGKQLPEIIEELNKVKESVATFGCAVTPCAVPGVGLLFEIEPSKIEMGLGIHGEAGIERIERPPIDELIELMIKKILEALTLPPKSRVCVLLNNLGSTSQLELSIIVGKIHSSLTKKNIVVERTYSGSFLTSLDMAGFQITILDVTKYPKWLDYLDSPTDAPAWPGNCMSIPNKSLRNDVSLKVEDHRIAANVGPKFTPEQSKLFEKCLIAIANAFIKQESRINELDTLSGDGDAGSTLKKFADVILKELPQINLQYPATSLYQLSKLCQNEMGGSSGALYGIFLTSAAKSLSSSSTIDVATTWKTAIDTLSIYSKAKIGDRTMMDVMIPSYEKFNDQKKHKDIKSAFDEAVKTAKINCEKTRHMKPRLGRASYVPNEYIKDVDPGAYGAVLWLEAISNTIKS